MVDPVVNVRVPADKLAEFDSLAVQSGESRSEVMRRALLVGLEQIKGVRRDLMHPVWGPLLQALVSSPTAWELLEGMKREEARAQAAETGKRAERIRKGDRRGKQ